jgi:O-antigen/teichoic acid export membrane protein
LGALIALSHQFIGVLFGDRFPLAAYYLQLLMLIYVYIGIGSGSISSLLNGQGETRINLIGALIRLLIGGSLAFYLIPNYGIPGLIISMTISQIPSLVYILVWIKRNLGISPDWRTSAKIFSSVIPSTVLTLIFVGTQSNLWIELLGGATIFVVSYLVLIKVLRVLDAADYELFRAIVGDTGVLARLVIPLIDLLEYGDLTHVRAR